MFLRFSLALPAPWLLPTREGRIAWQALIVAAAGLMTVTLGCIVPFAAMATLASRTLSARAATATLLAAVAANQLVAFVFLGYPHNLETALWIPVFTVAALAAFAISRWIAQPAFALVASFAGYESVLAAYTYVTSQTLVAFAPSIVAQIALGNLLGLAILAPLYFGLFAIERSTDHGDARAAR
jgi:hypothetical protein